MEYRVTFQSVDQPPVTCPVLHLAPHSIVCEATLAADTLRTSTALTPAVVRADSLTLYTGRGVVTSLVNTGSATLAEIALDDPGAQWPAENSAALAANSTRVLRDWLSARTLLPEFKLVVADLAALLAEATAWCDAQELRLRPDPHQPRPELSADALEALAGPLLDALGQLTEHFEESGDQLTPEQRPAHRAYARRLLGAAYLRAPFGQRSFAKPLGYAGDYEMMNMIHRRQPEGSSLFGQLLHYWLVCQWPAESVRQRVTHLQQHLRQTVARPRPPNQGPFQILCLGCGPAREVDNFLRDGRVADRARLTLIDFDAETLAYVARTLADTRRREGRHTDIITQQMSAQQLLRTGRSRSTGNTAEHYDLVYCGGLFDYLNDATCRQLVEAFHRWLAPGGLLVVSNMETNRRFRNMLEFLLDWHLIYRDAAAVRAWRPAAAESDPWTVVTDPTGVNLFLEIRKSA